MGKLNGDAYRKLHIQSGEPIRWLKAIPVPVGTAGRLSDGVVLAEQTLADDAKFLVSSTTRDYDSKEFGPILTGTMQISARPQWARFNHLDRVVLTAPGRLLSSIKTVKRGATDTDALPLPYAMSITNVFVAGVAITGTYELSGNGIKWLTGAPAQGVGYSVEFLRCPRFIVLPQSHRTSPTDSRGESLPLHYWLEYEQLT